MWGQSQRDPKKSRESGRLRRGGPRSKKHLLTQPWEEGKGWARAGKGKGATSTICPKSSTYVFSVSTSSLRTYLGREQV